jgi:NAD(P)-dependent dehydrogenase (short-subunit alcohol dehydrogenase family)
VNGVSPGVVDTEMWKMPEKEREEFMEQCAKGTATGAPGLPEDVAEAYLCALKDKNMDSTILRTDGGAMIM